MAWFKVDDLVWSHPKFAALSDAAQALWLRAGAWSAQHLTDGRIPLNIGPMIRLQQDAAQELVDAGLWRHDGDAWEFHDWCDYQPTREKVTSKRETDADRQRRHRERQKEEEQSRRDSRETSRPSHSAPSRPVPTPESAAQTPSGKPRKKSATTIPDDWAPTDSHLQKAQERGVDLQREAEQFRLHAEANDRRCVNWNSAFAMWLNKAYPNTSRQQQAASSFDPWASDWSEDDFRKD